MAGAPVFAFGQTLPANEHGHAKLQTPCAALAWPLKHPLRIAFTRLGAPAARSISIRTSGVGLARRMLQFNAQPKPQFTQGENLWLSGLFNNCSSPACSPPLQRQPPIPSVEPGR